MAKSEVLGHSRVQRANRRAETRMFLVQGMLAGGSQAHASVLIEQVDAILDALEARHQEERGGGDE